MLRIGLISDTHGLLRPEAERFLRGCERIVHAGDVGDPDVLARLAVLAPVTAVRGNNDIGAWAAHLPDTQAISLGGVSIFVLHDLKELAAHSPPAGAQVVVSGHSHRPKVLRQACGMLMVNPGSAGPRRFKLPVTAAELLIEDGACEARLFDLLACSFTASG